MTLVYINAFGASLLGGSPEMIIGQNLADLFPPKTVKSQGENIARVFDKGKTVHAKGRFRFGNQTVWLSTKLIPISDDNGMVTMVMGISRDITELKKTEQELKDRELKLRQRLKHAAALNQLGNVLVTSSDETDLLKKMTEGIGQALGVDTVFIYRVDSENRVVEKMGEWLNPREAEAKPAKKSYDINTFAGGIQDLWQNRKPLISHYNQVNPMLVKDGSSEILHGKIKIKSVLWYPFDFRQNIYHILALSHLKKRHDWSEEELRLVDSFTNQLTVALQKIKLLEQKDTTAKALKEP